MANDCTEPLSLLPSEVARLVLGYLRDTDCKPSYESFLNSSPFLQECRHLMSTGKTFRTQVMGMELVDILNQYVEIDALVQAELKKRDPDYAANTQNYGNLLEKLKHLLNASTSRQKLFLSITVPSSKSPQKSLPHARKRSKLVKTTSQDDTDPSVPEAIDSNGKQDSVEATALTSLPGTVQRAGDDVVDHSPTKHCLVSPARSNDTDNTPKRIPDETFNHYSKLDNETTKEKQVKNKEVKTVIDTTKSQQQLKPDASHTVVSSSLSMALDDAMETIARDNVDPVFDRFLGDIIGPVASRINNDYEEKNSNNQPQYVGNAPSQIDHQNAAAIESIIQMNSVETVSKESSTASATSPAQDTATPATVTTTSSGPENLTTVEPAKTSVDVPSSASLGNVTDDATAGQIAMTAQQPVPPNHIIGLPNNMLLGPVSTTPATLVPTSENHVFLVNSNGPMSQPIVIHSTPFQLPTRAYISEQELLSMPTVILCEEGKPSTSFVQQPIVCSTVPNGLYTKSVRRPRDLAPKKPPDCKAKVSKRAISKSTTDSNILLRGKGNPITQFTAQDQASNIQYNITVTQADLQIPTENIPLQTKLEPVAKDECITDSDADMIKDPQAKILTPKGARSHIRALDFSSPPKQSPKSNNRPLKGTNASKVRLFTSPDIPSVPIATRSPMMKLSGDWDGVQGADLICRTDDHTTNKSASENNASTQQPIQQSSPTQSTSKQIKQKSWDEDLRTLALAKPTVALSDCIKSHEHKPKRKKSIEKNVEKDVMNSTETDAKEIEKQLAALEDAKVKESSTLKTKSKRTTKQTKISVKKNAKRGRKSTKQRNDENCPDKTKSKSSTSESSSSSKPVKVLSLSKMNANKRTLDMNLKEPIMQDTLVTSTPDTQNKGSDMNANPAPEVGPANTWNSVTCLQTPGKNSTQSAPVTPSIDTPFFQTPFQKIYRENFGSVDISSIPTPSIPLTPFCDDPTFETRPTDYSNSSSYYQPSDTEQNQKIENALVEEHIKMRTNKLLDKSKSPNESISLHESSGSDANVTVLPLNSRYSLRAKSKTEQQVRSKIVNRERKSKTMQKSRRDDQNKSSDSEKIVKMKKGKVAGTKRGRKRREKPEESSKSEECTTPSSTISDRQMGGGSSRDIGEEEIPRLQVSDDDVTGERTKSNALLSELKERGIILMPKKTTDTNDIVLEESPESPCKENTSTSTNTEDENILKIDESEEKSKLSVCDKIETITIDEECSSSDEKLLLSNPESPEFDIKTITDDSEEYFKINQTSTCKKMTDYNMELLKKKINANVYLEHIDTNIVKILAMTPVINLLSVESGKNASSTEFMKQITEPTPPLSEEKEKFVSSIINIDDDSDVEIVTKPTKSSPIKPILNNEITERILEINDNGEDVEVSEDQLFSYAITCGKRHADQSPTEVTTPKRRKTPAPEKPVQTKPKNSRALLRWYGLDSLLSKVHGPSS